MTLPELPQNTEAEQAVLGSILLNRDAIVAVASWLLPEFFYMQRHAQIYEAMLACYNARIPPDVRTVSEELRRRDRLEPVGGLIYLAQLVNQVPTSYHIEWYARIVERAALRRKLIDTGGKIAALGYQEEQDLEQTLDNAERALFEVSQRRAAQDFVHIGQVIDSYYEQINYLQEHRGEVVGIPTSYRDLDQITGGLQRSDLIILAARPGVGKTSFVMSLAYNVALDHQGTVGVFSLEMSREQLVQRLLAMDTGIDTHRLRLGQLREDEMERVIGSMGKLAAAPIYIEDAPGLSIMEVRSRARRLQSQAGVDLIIVDYLQLMAGRRSDNRVQEVSEISRGLKALARELNVPLIALSQLSRAVEGRTSHIPMLSDLRESGCLAGESLVYLPDEGIYRRMDDLVGKTGFNVLAVNTETWKLEKRAVTNAFSTGMKPVYKLVTRLGRSIRATGNHKFLTINGWKRLDELVPKERLAMPHGRGEWSGSDGPRRRAKATRLTSPSPLKRAETAFSPLQRASYSSRAALARGRGDVSLFLAPMSRLLAEREVADIERTSSQAQSDIYWDEIVSIELDGEDAVYDLTVEGLHNFVVNDIIAHNSIEQDADIVMFIYREELYDQNTEKKGIAEIHIAKHRNGPVGVVPMRFEPGTTRFYDLTYRSAEGY
jgi:replicative DNA helicase